MKRRRTLLITLSIVVVVFLMREAGLLGFDWYSSESTVSADIRPGGNYVRYPFIRTRFKEVSHIHVENLSKNETLPGTAIIQWVVTSDVTPYAWIPFYKSGHSRVVAVFQAYYQGNPIGAEFYGTFNVELTIKGICSHRTYSEKIKEAAMSPIGSYIVQNLQKQDVQ